jgi:hypothetical protein
MGTYFHALRNLFNLFSNRIFFPMGNRRRVVREISKSGQVYTRTNHLQSNAIAVAINLQNIDIAGVVLSAPMPNERIDVIDVTVIALPASCSVAASRRSGE